MKKSKKYFELINRFEKECLPDGSIQLWQVEKTGEFNAFSIIAYQAMYNVLLAQVWYNGDGIHAYLPDGENTWSGTKDKIFKLCNL